MANNKLHIALFPWLAFGHLLPFYHLATRIAVLGHRISFLSSPRNLRRLPPVPPHLSHLLLLVDLPLAPVKNLSSDAEATVDLPTDDLRPYLRIAYDSLQHPLRQFLLRESPDWILYDYAAFWVPSLAHELGVSCGFLSIFNAAGLAFLGPPESLLGGKDARTSPEALAVKPKWIDFDSKIALSSYEARACYEPAVIPDTSGVSEFYRFGKSFEGCQIIAVRTSMEFESNLLHLLRRIYGKPVVPTGFYTPKPQLQGHRNDSTIQWLDKQKPRSVLFAAFGSEMKFTGSHVLEIACGLEQSEVPFVWVLRAPPEVIVALPGDFLDRLKGRGVVCLGWAPQTKLLAHPSVGGFLTHAGWSSAVEGLSRGLAMVMLPFIFDQGMNTRDLVVRGMGVEVARNNEDGSFVGEAIAEAVKLAMVDERGEAVRAKALEARDLFGDDELNERYVERFVKYLAGDIKRSL